ncbi:TetR/AcrR family transcriptional regulator [Naasia aerilata]|uniref:TetR/AcrR family transcriptional regulator n=1 Tax=Naasia aerilata TaxID=1162966 RepID=UPI0025723B35|nr:TetR/AcrR family transcriptional regulator [Naasia aerilata]
MQTQRARAAEETRERILDAFVGLVISRSSVAIPLQDVARQAGVTVQTILRRFGSRDRLFDEALVHGQAMIAGEREAPAGDAVVALSVLVDHYELRGDAVLALLATENADPRIARIVDAGRETHRRWVAEVFADALLARSPDDRVDTARLLVVATDVYAWKLLRRDMALTRSDAERHLLRLVGAVLSAN